MWLENYLNIMLQQMQWISNGELFKQLTFNQIDLSPFLHRESLIKKELRHTLGTPGGLTVFCFSRGHKDFAGP